MTGEGDKFSPVAPGAICQIEIPVTDVESSLRFYEHVFGWRRSPAEIQEYIVLETPSTHGIHGHSTGGAGSGNIGVSLIPGTAGHGRNASPHTVIYFKVEDPAEIARRAETFGGAKRFGPRKIPSYGEIWRITDPDGNQFGLFK